MWSSSNRHHHRGGPVNLMPIIAFIVLIIVLSALKVPWWLWIPMFFVVPMLLKAAFSAFGRQGHHRGHAQHWGSFGNHSPWANHDAGSDGRSARVYPGVSVHDWRAKRKRGDNDGESKPEKPKNTLVYVVGDDGELVEKPVDFAPPKRGDDGYDYV